MNQDAEEILEEIEQGVITEEDWALVHRRYIASFGHTFTSFALPTNSDHWRLAYWQMILCLGGSRKDPVTDEDLGLRGEGVYED